jgi:uncharacterized damage-inducible protein DinB
VRGEVVMMLGYLEKRAMGLLEAMPQEKLSWRPAEGARSASEIFMHMAISPFFLASMVGLPRPKDLSGKLEKTVTDKAQIAEYLRRGFDQARKAVHFVSDADLDTTKKNPFMGVEMSKRLYLMGTAMHGASHLAQLGVYARMNGITPPWIIEEMKRREQMKKKKSEAGAGEKKEEK